MRRSFIPALGAALALAACSTTGAMQTIMSSWVGATVDDVISQWGYPRDERTIAGRRLLYWQHANTYSMPVTNTSTGTVRTPAGVSTFTARTTGQEMVYGACTRILEVGPSGRVTSWQWEGNDCCVMAVAGMCKDWIRR